MADDLSSSLVREYLSRKGLKKTLGQLDLELPRTENSISKRNALARSLHIESIIKKCKATPTLQSLSMLECLVQYILENPIDTQNVSHTPNYIEPIPKDGKPITSRIEPHPPSTEPRPPATDSRLSNSKIKPRVSGGVTSTGLLSMSKSRGRVKIRNISKGLINDDKRTVIESNHPISHEISHDIKPHDSSLVTGNTATSSTIVCEDVEDSSVDITLPTQLANNTTHINNTSSPISLNIAKSLRELVFGTATGPSFNDEWRLQGITMVQSIPELSYGIVQHKGGPCGILACVQAYILKYVLFGENTTAKKLDSVLPLSARQQQIAVIEAICEILWKVHTNAVIVTLKGSTHNVVTSIGSRGYSPDGLTEQLQICQFTQYELLKDFITKNIHQFTSADRHSDGIILLLYSIVLSHGIAQIQKEMDSPCNILLGSHGYCSQELINLILTANASSNVFNGQSIIDEDNAPPTILRGVTSQCEIGYLTLFEYYKSCQVGSHYKNPSLPIWIVCAESHYTVLFSCNIDCIKDNTTRQRFSLHYYDGLAHFTEPIILELSFDDIPSLMNTINDLTPPLELVIRTRWPDFTSLKWNCDPLL